MSFQFMPAAIFGLTLYVLAGVGVFSIATGLVYVVVRAIGFI